ncbi:MAG: GNAT family N-acetyltransferase, partial [Candidatus Rokubacteria bacterium]|nr:GNAT family N-acetyltransferase [Candidatus Rokubacteria bacterium]
HARTRLRSPFLTWTWQTEWVRAFAADRRLEIWRVDDDEGGGVVAVLPLYEAEPGRWRLVGGADVSDYLDLVAAAGREEEAWGALLGARAASGAAWELHAVPAASPTVTALPALAEAFGLRARVAVEERCPVLALPASWTDYLASLSGKQRHELGRKMRRLEREVPEARAVSVAARAAGEVRFGDFLDLHRRSRTGKARFMDSRMEGFFRRMAAALADRGMMRLWFLDTAGGPLATFMTIEWDGTVGLYNSGFHPERAVLAPGLVLLAHVIRDAIERGMRRFDFLRGEERYKYDFGAAPEDVCAVTIAPARHRP